MNTEPNHEAVQQAQRPAEPHFIEQVALYRNLYHTKLQCELRQRHQNQHQIQHCNTILTHSRHLMEMHEKGDNKSEAFKQLRQSLFESIQKFESYRFNHPLISTIPPSPRSEKRAPTTSDGSSSESRSEVDARERRLPGMQEGDVFL